MRDWTAKVTSARNQFIDNQVKSFLGSDCYSEIENNPGEIDLILLTYGHNKAQVQEFFQYVSTIVDNQIRESLAAMFGKLGADIPVDPDLMEPPGVG